VVENALMERGAADVIPGRGWAFSDYWYSGNFESKFNVLRNCTIHGYDEGENDTEDTITLAHNAHHNLLENNFIGECGHVSLNQNSGTTHNNVFRNNFINNPVHTAFSAYGLGESNFRQDHHLLEGNIMRASAETVTTYPGNALQFSGSETIIRYNEMSDGCGPECRSAGGGISMSAGGQGRQASDNRFYHNTIVHNIGVGIGSWAFSGTAFDKGRNRFWNNFIYDADGRLVAYWREFDDGQDRWVRNVFGEPGGSATQRVINVGSGSVSVATAAASYTNPSDPEFSSWSGFANVYDAALNSNTFVDYQGKDYALRASSPYVDAGAPLTRVASGDSGSGTTLLVEDARVFYGEASEFPAWMGVHNDWIAIGSDASDTTTATKVQINSVDDDTGMLTLSRAVSRDPGDFVWLWKDSDGTVLVKGQAPDIGAYEH
jgi:hypothetical protein